MPPPLLKTNFAGLTLAKWGARRPAWFLRTRRGGKPRLSAHPRATAEGCTVALIVVASRRFALGHFFFRPHPNERFRSRVLAAFGNFWLFRNIF